MRAYITTSCLLLLGAGVACAQSGSEFTFLANQVDGRELTRMLSRYLKAKAYRQLEQRQQTVDRITSSRDLESRRDYIRRKMLDTLGGLPERTPLNARVTGALDRGDHRVEKIVFESQPGFFVTANLYLPKTGQAPYPAILFPLGHEAGAKAHSAWQQVLVSLARRGYVALAWDTLGQGERIQLWDDAFKESKVVRSTTEHTILGLQCVLLGDALARYTVWDGMRALDYLLSRPEVDRNRVGLTGNSGGGTHTAYLGALDDRFHVAAPSCYLTSWRRLLDTIGPQDAEQCLPPSLADGLDHPDFVLAFAPKPYLMLTAIRDFFSIGGARETYSEALRIYDRIGQAARFSKFEADDGHGYTLPRREAAYRWFGKWLQGAEDTRPEEPVTILAEDELWATRSGQVSVEFKGETVHSLNVKRLAEVGRRGASAEQVRKFIQFDPSASPTVAPFGTWERSGFRIEKLTIQPEPGIVLPALLYLPSGGGRKPGIVFVHGQGKAAAHADAESLAKSGRVVLSVDLRGLGETRTADDRNGSDWPRWFGDYEASMIALLTGKPLVAMRAEDVYSAVTALASRPEADPSNLAIWGRDIAAVPALYAAAFDSRVKSLWLERMTLSYESSVRNPLNRQQWENAVRGALRHYDLPDLARAIAPRRVQLVDAADAIGQLVPLDAVRAAYPGAHTVRRRTETAADLMAAAR